MSCLCLSLCHFGSFAFLCVPGLLAVDHTKRLGSLKRGVVDVKTHKWLYGVDWVCCGFAVVQAGPGYKATAVVIRILFQMHSSWC